jgi:hypothetical protein
MKSWTKEEIDFLKKYAAKGAKIKKMAEALRRTHTSVSSYMKKYGIKNGNDGRFVKGQKAWNKEVKGCLSQNSTSFKKGSTPANTKYDGAISLRQKKGDPPYKYIRVSKGKWELLHRYIWKQANGPIDKGYIITFKDGDSLNCDLSNLEMISMKENVLRNSNREKASESMKRAWAKAKAYDKYGLRHNYKLRTGWRKEAQS